MIIQTNKLQYSMIIPSKFTPIFNDNSQFCKFLYRLPSQYLVSSPWWKHGCHRSTGLPDEVADEERETRFFSVVQITPSGWCELFFLTFFEMLAGGGFWWISGRSIRKKTCFWLHLGLHGSIQVSRAPFRHPGLHLDLQGSIQTSRAPFRPPGLHLDLQGSI